MGAPGHLVGNTVDHRRGCTNITALSSDVQALASVLGFVLQVMSDHYVCVGVSVGVVEVVVVAPARGFYCQGFWGAKFASVFTELSHPIVLDINVYN